MRSPDTAQPVAASPETVAVVGAGVVGLCTALQAQRKGYRVTLIDRDAPGQGTSFGNAGYLLVWESADRLEEARAHVRYLQQWGVHTELVDATLLAQLEPALAGTVSHALYFPEACQVRKPYQLCCRLFAALEAHGGRLVHLAVEGLPADAQQVQLKTADSALRVDQAVICAGAWCCRAPASRCRWKRNAVTT